MQLSDILYKVTICSNNRTYEYNLFAQNDRVASRVARELFSMECQGEYIETLGAQVVYPTDEERRDVTKKLINVYGGLKAAIVDKRYRDFIMAYKNYDGFKIVLDNDLQQSFRIKFMGFEVEVDFINGKTEINESEIIYTDVNLGRTYIIRDGLQTIYIGA